MNKKLFSLGIAIMAAIGCIHAEVPTIHFTKYFSETHAKAKNGSVQGAAIFGDYLFQFHNRCAHVAVYQVSTKQLVNEIKWEGKDTYHCNNVVFSSFYFQEGDEFPLCYVSMENIKEHCILAYRFTRTNEGFEAKLVQTITLPRPIEMGVYYPNLMLDVETGSLYVTGYTRESWNKPDNGNGLVMLKWKMPLPSDGDVSLSTTQILDRKNMAFRIATQGACIRNGKAYQVFGVPSHGETSVCCYNLEENRLEWSVDLPTSGFAKEPEALTFYQDEMILVDDGGGVFKSGYKVPWNMAEDLKTTAPQFYGNPTGKRLVCVDLDATITQHRTPLEKFNRDALRNLCNRYKTIMVCAGNAQRVWEQMNRFPIDIIGNYGMQETEIRDGQLVVTKQITQPVDTAFFLKKTNYLRKKYGYTQYQGAPVEFHASGMVTMGLLGTTAEAEQKVDFDPDRAKRRLMYPEVCKIFKKYSVYIGGSSSFDFAGKKFNKYEAIMSYARDHGYKPEEIIFIGDDFDDGGGDSHVRIHGLDYIAIDDYHNFPIKTAALLFPR